MEVSIAVYPSMRSEVTPGRRTLKAVLGDLVQTTNGKRMTRPPARCPNGHALGPGQILVGHAACTRHGGGHTTWTCRTCDATAYGPARGSHCAPLDGPAKIRISNIN
jgi:hypothetical protein